MHTAPGVVYCPSPHSARFFQRLPGDSMSLTQKIAEYISVTGLEDFPPDAIDAAKAAITDCLGCTLAGSVEPLADVLCSYVNDLGGKPAATVIGRGFRTSALEAALVNGAMSHALDYDDVTFITKTHPSAALIPGRCPLGKRLVPPEASCCCLTCWGSRWPARWGTPSARRTSTTWAGTRRGRWGHWARLRQRPACCGWTRNRRRWPSRWRLRRPRVCARTSGR